MTTLSEIISCADLGVDAVGFMVRRTPPASSHAPSDKIDLILAKSLIASVPQGVTSVFLVHTSVLDEILFLSDYLSPGALQIQVSITMDDLDRLRSALPTIRLIKTVHISPGDIVSDKISEVARYVAPRILDGILLDSRLDTRTGGTGVTHDWAISSALVNTFPTVPLLLAGGLNAHNVGAAVHRVRPYALDVLTGVKDHAGRKDPGRILAFVSAVRDCGTETTGPPSETGLG